MSDLGKVLEKLRQEREKVSTKGYEYLRKEQHTKARECGLVIEGLDFSIDTIRKQFDSNDPR